VNKIVFYILFYILFLIIEIFNWLGFLCDEIFYRSYKKTDIKEPLFIVGMPRTATSFLFYVLSEDKDRFSAMKLWEILFAPSVTQKKFLIFLYKLDKLLNGFFLSILKKIDYEIFHRFKKIHSISLLNVEEDEYILMHNLSCSLLVFIFPKWSYIHSLIKFDQDLSESRKKRIMAYYRKCIQKHLYVFAPNKIYLAKSPSHTSKIDSLKNTFIGCKFIYMLRIPEECISSAIGMYQVYNKIFRTKAKAETLAEVTLSFADLWYTYTGIIEEMSKDTAIILKYDDVVKNPDKSIRRLYKLFGYQLSESFESKLALNAKRAESYKSGHKHSLRDNGLKISDIRERYRKIYDDYFYEN
jgi:omega-hydroxy-beta-dihydromenaquinone-9 sulfotransferase